METERLLRLPDVEAISGLKRATIYREAQRGNFPKPLKLTARASAWQESEVRQWIARRIEEAARRA